MPGLFTVSKPKTMTARDTILARVREALQVAAPLPGHPDEQASVGEPRRADREARTWLPQVGEAHAAWLEKFAANSNALKTDFHAFPDEAAAHAKLRQMAEALNWRRIGTHQAELTDRAVATLNVATLTTTGGYDVAELERCDAGVTECDALIAQTGSVLLTARSGGGRALSVLPPHHVVLARRDQLLPDLPAAYELLHQRYGNDWPSMMTLITGPSRTGDIERILVLGAHGPKRLTILMW